MKYKAKFSDFGRCLTCCQNPCGCVKLPCLECGKAYRFEPSSNEAKGIFNVFCKSGECEDRYSFKQ